MNSFPRWLAIGSEFMREEISLMAAADPQSAGYAAGQVAGQVIMLLAVAAGLYKCWSISRRPQTNTKCVLALAIFLVVWLVSGVVGALGRRMGEGPPPLVIGLLGIGAFALIVTAVV